MLQTNNKLVAFSHDPLSNKIDADSSQDSMHKTAFLKSMLENGKIVQINQSKECVPHIVLDMGVLAQGRLLDDRR